MEVRTVLGTLADAGVKILAAGERLWFRPRSAVTPELLSELAEHKMELINLLARHPDPSPPYDCIRCRRPVVLKLNEAWDGWTYRCICGNRSKVAAGDYEKLVAFDRLREEYERDCCRTPSARDQEESADRQGELRVDGCGSGETREV